MTDNRLEKIAAELGALIKGEVLVDIFNRVAFSSDASIYQIMPLCVVRPLDTADVVDVVKYAHAQGIPIAGRGAGTGLAGEALTDGIVIDLTTHMNKIIGAEQDGQVVVCQPGVVLDTLNDYLAQYGKKIGPDPSSSNRAVIGGVVANNSTGAHSLQYGYIAEYVERLKVVLADGSVHEFVNGCDPAEEGVWPGAKECRDMLRDNHRVIAMAQPSAKRNRSGYNISGVCHGEKIDLAKLMVGSEGTLGIFTEMAIRTVDLPKAKALLQLEFSSRKNMAKAVPIIVDTGASACELMGERLIKMAAEALPDYRDIFPENCAALLLIEHTGDSADIVRQKIEKTDAAAGQLASGRKFITDPAQMARLWKSRKDAVPLLHRKKGSAHPVAFIEDVAVGPDRLGEYISGMEAIGKRYEIPMAFYGHAGDGELHIRPYLDLSDSNDVTKMRQIAEEVFELAWLLGGTISGEHADGMVRAAFIEKQYGPEYYELLKRIKTIFDPDGIMNPGKIISGDPAVMTENLRASKMVLSERTETNLLFDPDEFKFEIQQCNGDGVCLSVKPGARMCPVFRAVGDELACSRAKANILRAWITGIIGSEDLKSERFKEVLSLCINCKMCSVECPSGVDISKLMMEARAEHTKQNGLSFCECVLAHNRLLSIAGSLFSFPVNIILKLRPLRWLMEKTVGLDRRRVFPAFQFGSFIKKGRKYIAAEGPVKNPVDKVAYFVDSYANYNDHELGFAVLKYLRHNNIDVILPDQLPAPLPAMSYGDVKLARNDLTYSVGRLAEVVKAGYKVVCSEPSAALCLKDEMRLFVDSDEARLVSQNTFELMSYLSRLNASGKLKSDISSLMSDGVYSYHSPCHLCALGCAGQSVDLLNKLTGIKMVDINAGCCGMAGTCGMQKKNYDLSVAIGTDMARAIDEMDADNVITECAACKMQIEHLTGKKVHHPIKILARAAGLL